MFFLLTFYRLRHNPPCSIRPTLPPKAVREITDVFSYEYNALLVISSVLVRQQSAGLYPVACPSWFSTDPRNSMECLPILSNTNYGKRPFLAILMGHPEFSGAYTEYSFGDPFSPYRKNVLKMLILRPLFKIAILHLKDILKMCTAALDPPPSQRMLCTRVKIMTILDDPQQPHMLVFGHRPGFVKM